MITPITLALAVMVFPQEQAPLVPPFAIQVIDEATGRGVPLVELRTVNGLRYYTDSNGFAAINEPELNGQRVYFHVESHGYEYPADGFGYRGKALDVTEGGAAILEVKRLNIAKRLYRITGAGIYRDSVLLGKSVPIAQPLLNAQVFGSDSVVNAVYRGQIHWFWGDTSRPGYPLGNFHVPGATSRLPKDGGLDPELGINLNYFVDDNGFAAETARMPGDGPTWISGLTVLRDVDDQERMFAAYVKIKPPLEAYEHGLAEFDPETNRFERAVVFEEGRPVYPSGHPFLHKVGDIEYVYFATPYPFTRVRAEVEALMDLAQYEAFTCLQEGSTLDDPQLDRDENGTLRYAWKRDTPPLTSTEQNKLLQEGTIPPEEALLALRDVETGQPLLGHGGSVYWNDHRQRWVMIVLEVFGDPSLLGEIWFAEADAPLGPWVYARKVVTHDKYSFYNPKQHPMFDQGNGRILYFEGTYTTLFSGIDVGTPRYDYNQILYKLDLDDPRLNLPVPIYQISRDDGGTSYVTKRDLDPKSQNADVVFFALEHAGEGTIPVFEHQGEDGGTALSFDPPEEAATPRFHVLPDDLEHPPEATAPLQEFTSEESPQRFYTTDPDEVPARTRRGATTLGRVWPNPLRVLIPRD